MSFKPSVIEPRDDASRSRQDRSAKDDLPEAKHERQLQGTSKPGDPPNKDALQPAVASTKHPDTGKTNETFRKLPDAMKDTPVGPEPLKRPRAKKRIEGDESAFSIDFQNTRVQSTSEARSCSETTVKGKSTRTAPIGPHQDDRSGKLAGAALSDWKRREGHGKVSYRLGKDHVVDEGGLIKGTTGSANEVKAMFELARSKQWSGVAFSGSDDFKRHVMETALKSNFQVQAVGEDALLLADVMKKMGYAPAQLQPATPDIAKTIGAEHSTTGAMQSNKAAFSQQPGPKGQELKDKPLSAKPAALAAQSRENHRNDNVGLPAVGTREESRTNKLVRN